MNIVLRKYQTEAIEAGTDFFLAPNHKEGNGIIVLPTGSGKSVVIAKIIDGIPGKTLVLQPSKEILEQNHAKLMHYGYRAGIYSASVGKKQIHKITFATIGSVIGNKHLFAEFGQIIIDECDLVNSNSGMYKDFIDSLENVRVLGLTATPYRLSNSSFGAMLKFLTRTRERVFKRVIYHVQTGDLFRQGYLAKLKYYDIAGFNRDKLKKNSTGADYDEKSLKAYYKEVGFDMKLEKVVSRLLEIGRKNILIFTQYVDEAKAVAAHFGCAYVTGQTKKDERERILKGFKKGVIKIVANVGVLTVGFDYPELETIVIARPTMSLRLYYQMIGRGIRIHPDKEYAMIVDMCDNISQFGHVEDLVMERNYKGLWVVSTKGRPLTNVLFGEGKPDYIK